MTTISANNNSNVNRANQTQVQPPPPPPPPRAPVAVSDGFDRGSGGNVAGRQPPPMPNAPNGSSPSSIYEASPSPTATQNLTQPQQVTGISPETQAKISQTITGVAVQASPQQLGAAGATLDQELSKLPPEQRGPAAELARDATLKTAAELPAATSAAQPKGRTEQVQNTVPADNLTRVASEYVNPTTGEPLTPAALEASNPELFDANHENGDVIQPGESVNIPDGAVSKSDWQQMQAKQAVLVDAANKFNETAKSALPENQPPKPPVYVPGWPR